MSVLIFFTSRYYYFFDKLKIGQKQLGKLNCFYGKVSHTLKYGKHQQHQERFWLYYLEKLLSPLRKLHLHF